MATAKKAAQGTWRIKIEIRNERESRTFPTQREADAWAAKRATEIRASGTRKVGTTKTLQDAMRRYGEVELTHLRGRIPV